MNRAPIATILVLAATTSLPAQWQLLSPGTNQADPGAAAAPFGARAVTISTHGAFAFDGRVFTPTAGPSARSGAAMALDRARNRIVLFGGRDVGLQQDLADTWEFDGAAWLQRSPLQAPLPRRHAAMAYDEWRQRTVMVGGFVGGLGTGDTWEWNGTAWTQRPAGLAGVRGGGACAFDAARGYVWLFGGATAFGGPVRDDLWRYDGNAWVRILGPAMPPARAFAALGHDRWSSELLLFGGEQLGGAALGDTWSWNGQAWTQRQPAVTPAARSGAAMVYDEERRRLVLIGGASAAGGRQEAFAWVTDPRPGVAPFGSGCGGLQLSATGAGPVLGAALTMNVGTPSGFLFGAAGFSNLSTSGAQPLPAPLPAAGCTLWIDPAAAILLPAGVGTWSLPLPSTPSLAGLRFFVQTAAFGAGGSLAASNGLDARIGITNVEQQSTAALDAATTDPLVSALATGVVVGGDGRHGSFDPTVGTDLGNGVYEWNTDGTTIPGRLTRSNVDEVVADGRFQFTDLMVPAGITVRFRGSNAAQLFVRGRVQVDGVIDVSGDAMEVFATGGATPSPTGQPGGRAGAGGGRGGAGGDRCTGFGPTIQGGVNLNDGVHGADVRVPAGHAFAAQAVGTGGRGAPLFPANGLNSSVVFSYFTVFAANITAGGGGGGYTGAGSAGLVVPNASVLAGPSSAGGVTFPLPVVPAGTRSLAHYLIGGSGGGGGGSHPYLIVQATPTWPWRSGAGGSGGGGALALRAGRELRIGANGRIEARGGTGFRFDSFAIGFPSPGGGGSGGSLLLQSTGLLQNNGQLDVSGSAGSVSDSSALIWATGVTQGGAGAPGRIRLESPQAIVAGTTTPVVTAADLGGLTDTDARSGMRSVWLPIGAPSADAVIERYELTVLVGGNPVVFSDDPTVGSSLADPLGFLVARFQGTRGDGGGNPDPEQAGPWRTDCGRAGQADNCNRDSPDFVRVDLTWPSNARPAITGLRIVWH